MSQTTETCENCGQTIGALETPQVWNDRVVCRTCKDKLAAPIGYATPAAPAASGSGRATTIELTAKKWKAQKLLAALTILVGFVLVFASSGADSPVLAGTGVLLMLGGLIWLITARILAWWHHG